MNPDNYLHPKKDNTKASRKQEDRVARRLGGTVQPGSGNGRIPVRAVRTTKYRAGRKGDVHSDLLLTECKTTEKKSISIKQDHLIKISGEAQNAMKSPAMVFTFPTMPEGVETDWAMVSLGFLCRLLEKAGLKMPSRDEDL